MVSRLEIDNKPFFQLILILTLCLISTIIFSFVGGLVTIFFYGIDVSSIDSFSDPKVIEGLKVFQLFSSVGLFLVPPIIYEILRSKNPVEKMALNYSTKPINYFLVLILMGVSVVFLSWVIELNASMTFPEFLSEIEGWMRNSEKQAEKLTQAFLTFNGIGSLFYILIIVAVIPALGEELLFRGVLQKILIQWFDNSHAGIWVTAILFSALHMQFFGFFPRLLLGLMFGYIFLWTKSLWVPIFGHFINNASVVIATYFYPDTMNNTDVSFFLEDKYAFVFYMTSFIISTVVFYLIRKVNQA